LISGTIDYSASASSPYAVTVRATAGSLSVTDPFTWTVTNMDRAPSATVSLSPKTPDTNALLTATASGTDPDGDAVRFTYTWTVNSTVRRTTGPTTATTDTFDLSKKGNGDAGQTVTVTVTPNDGTLNGPNVSDSTIVAGPVAPGVPTGLTAVTTSTAIVLDWADNYEVNLAGYNVSRAASSSGPWTKLNGSPLIPSTLTDAAAPVQATSYYQVTAVNSAGQESAAATISATRKIALRADSSSANGGKATISITKPRGAVAGDLLLAVLDVAGAGGITPPTGWTAIRSDAAGTSMTQFAYYKRAGASEPSSYSWSFSSARLATGVVIAYSGVSTVSPVGVSGGQVNASSISIAAPAVSTTVADSLVVGFFGIFTNTTITPPSGMIEQGEQAATLSGKQKPAIGVTTEVADLVQPVVGSTDSRTATGAKAAVNIGQLIVLIPA
ncbi:MAG: hypothetical protein ACXVEY_12180, partial [Actinomycetota bacterium]